MKCATVFASPLYPLARSQTPTDRTTPLSTARDLTVSSGTLSLGAGTYYIRNLSVSGGAVLQFTGPVTMYVTGSVNISAASVSTYANVPANFRLFVCSSSNVVISGSAVFYGDVYAPESAATISGSGALAGRIVALSLTESGGSKLYYDQSLMGGYASGVLLAQ